MMQSRSTCFALEKLGSSPLEWEDAAAFRDGSTTARFVVVDGATEAYDALRWVEHLAGSFVADDGPALDRDGLRAWFTQVQAMWAAAAPDVFASVIEELKFRDEGSFATFLGARLVGLDGAHPRWEAAALGDTVLFHVRDRRLLAHFPPLDVESFGLSPDGISTHAASVEPMARRLEFAYGDIRAGDLLFMATDALAQWLLVEARRNQHVLWDLLADVDHDATFAALVADQRAAGRLHNDDVTLLRVAVDTAEPSSLVVCL
ncbi:hypothetical protein [Pseudonocardia sp. TRM90224]|uniref:hypothetical protein n=1 Tax=Pseudonocardia sp. TRM90224 TaxID=2812678 RepID=UPI001E345B7C|nr:hypothetical protein [Pseudonocardia sp. TRM90224]